MKIVLSTNLSGYVLAMSLSVSLAACVTTVRHNFYKASEDASRFAELAFVERRFAEAYALMSDGAKEAGSQEDFEKQILQHHPDGFPFRLQATEWERTANPHEMAIYLVGENTAEKFYYRLLLVGNKRDGYKVSSLATYAGGFPPSDSGRPLQLGGLAEVFR